MDNRSENMFSSPENPSSDPNEFEFGYITPTSPSSNPHTTLFPADHFFQNGRLLPHSFPIIQSTKSTTNTSRANSISSKDSLSLISSRSNSANSSRSGTTSCSSARTSASDSSERKAFQKRLHGSYVSVGVAQRWQFITPGPGLDSRRRRLSGKNKNKKKLSVDGEGLELGLGFCKRVLRCFVRSCRACHAMEGAVLEGDHAFGSHLELK